MEKLWVGEGSRPEKVVQLGDVHYFYWEWELGFYWSKLGIPILFIKKHDYEPVKRVKKKTVKRRLEEVFTRYHYRFLVRYRRPRLFKGRPVVRFVGPTHMPIIASRKPERYRIEIKRDDFTVEDYVALIIFQLLLKTQPWKQVKEREIKDYGLNENYVPEEAIFNSATMPHTVIVG